MRKSGLLKITILLFSLVAMIFPKEEIKNNLAPSYDVKIDLTENKSIFIEEELNFPLAQPIGLDIDEEGNLFLIDYIKSRLIKITKGGEVSVISKEGKGPGDLLNPRIVRIKNKEVYVFLSDNRCEIFTLDLKFRREIKIPFFLSSIVVLKKNVYILDAPFPHKGIMKIKLEDLNSNKSLDIIEFPIPNIGKSKYEAFDYFYNVLPLRGGFIIGASKLGYRFWVYDAQAKLKYKFSKKYRPIRLSSDYKRNFLEELKRKPQIFEFLKGKLYFPEYFSPYEYFFACDDGKVFVETWERKSGKSRVDIFYKGIFSGSVFLPHFSIGACRRNNVAILYEENDEWKLNYYKISLHFKNF